MSGDQLAFFERLARVIGVETSVLAVLTSAFIVLAVGVATNINNQRINRKRATVDYLAKLMIDNDFITAQKKFFQAREDNILTKVFSDNDPGIHMKELYSDYKRAIALVLNTYELICIGIKSGSLDAQIYMSFQKTAMLKDWDSTQELIVHIRTGMRQKAAFQNYEDIVHRWRNRTPRLTLI